MWVKIHRITAGSTTCITVCEGVFDPPQQGWKSPTSRSAGSENMRQGSRFNLISCNSPLIPPV